MAMPLFSEGGVGVCEAEDAVLLRTAPTGSAGTFR